MTNCPVSIASDLTVAFQAGHMVPMPDADLPAPMNWEPGHTCGTHALAGNVKHKGEPLVQEGHDLGAMIPHLLMSVAMFKSSRKIAFAASTVVIKSKPVGCTKLSLPMLACADITLPLGDNAYNFCHSVIVGMTDFDVGIGWFDVATAAVVDTIASYLGGNIPAAAPSEAEGWNDMFGLDYKKGLIAAPFALVRSVLVSGHNDWKTPIGTKFGVGGGVAGGSREVAYDPVKKTLTVKDTLIGPGGSFEHSAEYGSGKVKDTATAKTPLAGGHEKTWGDKL